MCLRGSVAPGIGSGALASGAGEGRVLLTEERSEQVGMGDLMEVWGGGEGGGRESAG